MPNKVIIAVNLYGMLGGAERRHINLFININQKSPHGLHLIINRNLYNGFQYLLKGIENVHILEFDSIFSVKTNSIKKDDVTLSQTIRTKKKSRIRHFLGRTKYLLKLFYGWFCFNAQVVPIIKRNKIKIVYAYWTGGIWSWHLQYLLGVRLIYGYMDSNYDSLQKNPLRFFESEYWALRNAQIVDCLSPKIANDLKRMIHFKPITKVLVIPNSFIDYFNFYPANHKENTIVFLARLYPLKNAMLLLEAWDILFNEMDFKTDFNLVIMGEGPEAYRLISYVKEHNLINVCFTGPVFETWIQLRKSKIFTSLQENDNYPSQSLIEAMACENAIIATDVGNTRFIVTEEEGILIRKDKYKLASALRKLIEDENLCSKLGKNARGKVINTHTAENFVTHFNSLMC